MRLHSTKNFETKRLNDKFFQAEGDEGTLAVPPFRMAKIQRPRSLSLLTKKSVK